MRGPQTYLCIVVLHLEKTESAGSMIEEKYNKDKVEDVRNEVDELDVQT